MTSNVPRFALRSTASTASAVWLSEPPDSAPTCATRIITCRCDASPYCCTTASLPRFPGSACSDARTRSSVGCGSANFTMTMVPPSNSTPSLSPLVPITAAPARITTSDKASAGHRHRTKL